jgi:hypothetical protein
VGIHVNADDSTPKTPGDYRRPELWVRQRLDLVLRHPTFYFNKMYERDDLRKASSRTGILLNRPENSVRKKWEYMKRVDPASCTWTKAERNQLVQQKDARITWKRITDLHNQVNTTSSV